MAVAAQSLSNEAFPLLVTRESNSRGRSGGRGRGVSSVFDDVMLIDSTKSAKAPPAKHLGKLRTQGPIGLPWPPDWRSSALLPFLRVTTGRHLPDVTVAPMREVPRLRPLRLCSRIPQEVPLRAQLLQKV